MHAMEFTINQRGGSRVNLDPPAWAKASPFTMNMKGLKYFTVHSPHGTRKESNKLSPEQVDNIGKSLTAMYGWSMEWFSPEKPTAEVLVSAVV
ncbi:hypothetical protein C8Q75DRAFT_752404 [Abortiporus biennis]|nr:hypothetical protein C8Q75DRAFT_752404 [Abortiporus biennis]